jgi:hypothetical protein
VEILKVTDLFDAVATSSCILEQITSLLDKVPASLSGSEFRGQDTWSRRYRKIHPEETSKDVNPEITRCKIILSRKERRRAAGVPDDLTEEGEVHDSGQAMDTYGAPMTDNRYTKRSRLEQDDHLNDSGIGFSNPLDFDHGSPLPAFYGDAELDPVDFDKENHPPFHGEYEAFMNNEDFDPEQSPRSVFPANFRQNQDEPGMATYYEHRGFEPLSFGSHQASAQPTQILADDVTSDETYAGMFEPHPNAIIDDSVIAQPFPAISQAPDIATRSLGIAEFAKLRARKVAITTNESFPVPQSETHVLPEQPSHSIPEHIYDRNTLRLPSVWNLPDSVHRYMVSMELVQKQGLIRSLRSRTCSIDLVERDTLGGVDVILDPHTAIIFTNLLILPSECVDLTSLITHQSWCYSRLLIIFEAYPAGRSYQSKASSSTASELFAYSPPILKALGKLRRDLGILEGCGRKSRSCLIQYAFADTVDEAAMFTRQLGDLAEINDESQGTIWGDRVWLEDDVPEVLAPPTCCVKLLMTPKGEQDLAAADGMNRFAAFVILCQIDLGEFLELTPEDRVDKFGMFVSSERMVRWSTFAVISHYLPFCRYYSIRLLNAACKCWSRQGRRWRWIRQYQ